METIYLKIKIKESDIEVEGIRDNGVFFETIAEVLSIERSQIVEINEKNYLDEIKQITIKYDKG